MLILQLIASVGMLVATVSSEAPAYGAPAAQNADPLGGINLAQLLSFVGQANAAAPQQAYGAPGKH